MQTTNFMTQVVEKVEAVANLVNQPCYFKLTGFKGAEFLMQTLPIGPSSSKEDLIFNLALQLRNSHNELLGGVKFAKLADKEIAIANQNNEVVFTIKIK